MALTFTEKSYVEMIRVQRKLAETLNRINHEGDRVEAALVAFALVRLARELLLQYSDKARVALVEQTIVPFLKCEPVESDAGKKLVLM